MAEKEKLTKSAAERGGDFQIEGRLQLEGTEKVPGDLPLVAYAFPPSGDLLGSAAVDPKGTFVVPVKLERPADIELLVGPESDVKALRQSSAFRQRFSAQEWLGEGNRFRLNPDIFLPERVWFPWRPIRVCVSGRVRKIQNVGGQTDLCPVPFVKVEIFDVDREGCWWPHITRWWDHLLDRPVFRIPDLVKDRPIPPRPGPDPAPLDLLSRVARSGASLLDRVSLNPQPLPPRSASSLLDRVSLNPQPLPPRSAIALSLQPLPPGADVMFDPQPDPPGTIGISRDTAIGRVGEVKTIAPQIASRLENLTLTSKVAPWLIFPLCFYSRQLVCETYTDCDGNFQCCFRWWPFHFRRGRLRFDSRPDIIIRVTQIINGVETVIYMDPYTSTRWNTTNAYIDLTLDNEDVRCGTGCHPQPVGSEVFFTRIGNDEVYRIDQTNGLYHDMAVTQVAYGSSLAIYGNFGNDLADGTPARYYRLSYAKQGSSDFKYVDTDLTDTRVNPVTFFSEDYKLGPKTVNTQSSLYEIRDRAHFAWYNPDWISTWHTHVVEEDTGTYVLRLEVFDENGVHLTTASGQVDYRDGTVAPPSILPPMIDHCDLVITLDNKPPQADVAIPAVLNECGVIPWSPMLTLNFNVQVTQENNRLHSWSLTYIKGVNPTPNSLASATSANGTLSPVNAIVSGAPLLVGLNTTCAFALHLHAVPHIRNGYTFIYDVEQIKAIAIEKCA